jgi:signal transduction histidine kinase
MRLSLLPQSLFARLLTGLLAAVGTALIIIVLLIVRDRRDLALWGSGAWSAASTIAQISNEVATADGREREALLRKYQSGPVILQERTPEEVRSAQFEEAFKRRQREIEQIERTFERRVRRQLGDDYSVLVTRGSRPGRHVIRLVSNPERALPSQSEPMRPGPGPRRGVAGQRLLNVVVTLPDGETLMFRAPAPLVGAPSPRVIFMQLGILTAVLAAVLFFMTRSITRPLSDLARAADAIGHGATHMPLQERGARELRNATRAFNAMQERLHRYLDSRTRVLAAMSHDLRTPLTRMRLRAESIEDDEMRAKFVADLDEMSAMVGGALNMFKGLTDSEATQPVLVDEFLATLKSEYEELGYEVRLEGRSNGPIQARPRALKRCISNLLHNAVQYGKRATIHIQDARELTVAIRDEGPGIPEADLEKVFEPFYRLEGSRSRDTGGSGLGLSIARDIAQAHGGSIRLRNVDGGGLEALLTLPHGRGGAAK